MVDLEEGDVVFVGDLADQGVVQVSVGGRGVIPIHGKNTDKWCIWNGTKNMMLTFALVVFYLSVFCAKCSCGSVQGTSRSFFSDPGCVNTLVEVRSVVVDVQHTDCHVNRPVHHFIAVHGLDLDAIANISSRRLQITS